MKTSAILSAAAVLAHVSPAAIAAPIIHSQSELLVERSPEPIFPLLFGLGSAVFSAVKGKRELANANEQLEAREPLFPLLFGLGSVVASAVKGKREILEQFERELGQLGEEYEARGYYLDEYSGYAARSELAWDDLD